MIREQIAYSEISRMHWTTVHLQLSPLGSHVDRVYAQHNRLTGANGGKTAPDPVFSIFCNASRLDQLQQLTQVLNSHRCLHHCEKSDGQPGSGGPACGLGSYCRNLLPQQWLRCLQLDYTTVKKF